MAQPALASIINLTARMGDVGVMERAQAALDDASALIRAEADPEDWIDDSGALEDVPAIVVTVCCKVAQRILANPDGLTSEGIGSYNQSFSNPSSDAYLTKSERPLIRRAAGSSPVGSVELQTPYRRINTEDIYMSVRDGEELPMGPWPSSST